MNGRGNGSVQTAGASPVVALFRPALRHCLTNPRLPGGARVACIGDDPVPLVQLLESLGLDTIGLCPRPEQVLEGRRLCPRADFQPITATERFAHSCDLVLNTGLTVYLGNLLDGSARQATAGLLSLLKPLGRMILLRRPLAREDFGHEMECWPRHLACFPGEVTRETVADAWLSRETWRWLRGKRTRPATTLITFEAPLELLSLDDWRDYARRGLLTGQRACCESAAALSTLKTIRVAA